MLVNEIMNKTSLKIHQNLSVKGSRSCDRYSFQCAIAYIVYSKANIIDFVLNKTDRKALSYCSLESMCLCTFN